MLLIITPEGIIDESPLTQRERDVLQLMSQGLQQKEIATHLTISYETVKKHMKNAYKKLGVHNRVQALQKSGFM